MLRPISACEVCGTPGLTPGSRCTNNRCLSCHRLYCTGGGATGPGHGRTWPKGLAQGLTLLKLGLSLGEVLESIGPADAVVAERLTREQV